MLRKLAMALLALTLWCSPAAAETYIVAGDCTWPPMETLDANKTPEGYSFDIIRAVAKAAGFEVEIRNIAWDGIFAGNYDIIASSTTITPERQKAFDFSDPYYDVHQAVIMPTGKSIATLDDLKGKKVGGQIGTTGIFVMQKANVGAVIREYDDVGLAIQDMVAGRIDAVICDDPVAKYYMNKKAEYASKLVIPLVTDDVEYYGFTVKKGRKDLVEKINKGLKIIRDNGTEAKIKAKWMGD